MWGLLHHQVGEERTSGLPIIQTAHRHLCTRISSKTLLFSALWISFTQGAGVLASSKSVICKWTNLSRPMSPLFLYKMTSRITSGNVHPAGTKMLVKIPLYPVVKEVCSPRYKATLRSSLFNCLPLE